jgi:hypothetical protein
MKTSLGALVLLALGFGALLIIGLPGLIAHYVIKWRGTGRSEQQKEIAK